MGFLEDLPRGRVAEIENRISSFLFSRGRVGPEFDRGVVAIAADIPGFALQLDLPSDELRLFFHGMHPFMSVQARRELRGMPIEEEQIKKLSPRRAGWWQRIGSRYPVQCMRPHRP